MMPMALLMESFKENAMLMDIPDLDMDLLIKGKKKIIVQKKLPGREVIDASIFRQKHPRVYLYNQNCGVFGESYCKLSFDNIEYTGEYPRKFYFYRKIDGYSRKQYKENPNVSKEQIEAFNSDPRVIELNKIETNLKIVDRIIVGSKNNYNLDLLFDKINKYKNKDFKCQIS